MSKAGDVVLVELPSYIGAVAAFRAAQARMVGVRLEDDGLDLEDLRLSVEDLENFGPTLIVDHTERGGDRVLVWSQ